MKRILASVMALALVVNVFSQVEFDNIDVEKYKINLDISEIETASINGFTEIVFSSKVNNLSSFKLYLQALTVDSILYDNSRLTSFSYNDSIIDINLPTALSLGEKDSLRVFYRGNPVKDPSTWGGFYFTSTYAYNLGVGFQSNPHNFGRVWFPCVDNFTDKALYDAKITTKSSDKAICGGLLLDSTVVGDKIQWHWSLANPISTYLASVAVAPYQCVNDTFEGQNGDIPINIYVPQNYVSKAISSFTNLKNILSAFEQYFGPYRWERVGYVGVPFNSGAMEHATNIAYPLECIDGSLSYELLYAHELSHHWFGNLVTCSSAEEMWINEGWAVFSEFVFYEAIYGSEAAISYVREKLISVLKSAHSDDGGFFAVCNVPHEVTYGTTVYDKGALVVHTLRNYMGDSLFFAAVKNMLSDFEYENITCQELCDYFSEKSGINLQDFFDAWVFQPGFPHYSVDSFNVSENSGSYVTQVSLKQKMYGKDVLANSNRVELCFMNNDWQMYRQQVEFSGESATVYCETPFKPDFIICDKDEKTADAIVSYDQIVTGAESLNNSSAYVSLKVEEFVDSCYIRSELHWVAPDPVENNSEIFRISPNHYWSINGIIPEGTVISAQFTFNRSASVANNYLDTELLPTSASHDSLVLLYRKDASEDWRIYPFTKTGNSTIGRLKVDQISLGEYAMAIGQPNQSSVEMSRKSSALSVFPNPSSSFTIKVDNNLVDRVSICDMSGKVVFSERAQKKLRWSPQNLDAGTYVVSAFDKFGNKISEKKIQYVKK